MAAIEEIFRIWHQSVESNSRSLDSSGKITYPSLALVSSINADNRTIRVADPVNPSIESSDLRRLRASASQDTYLPSIGSTVLCWYIDGIFSNGWFFPVENATNPPLLKEDPLRDHSEIFPGSFTITVQNEVTIKTPSGCSIKFDKDGGVTISNQGNKITMIEGDGIQFTSDEIVRINGAGIMVENGSDSDGDIMTSTGQ